MVTREAATTQTSQPRCLKRRGQRTGSMGPLTPTNPKHQATPNDKRRDINSTYPVHRQVAGYQAALQGKEAKADILSQ